MAGRIAQHNLPNIEKEGKGGGKEERGRKRKEDADAERTL